MIPWLQVLQDNDTYVLQDLQRYEFESLLEEDQELSRDIDAVAERIEEADAAAAAAAAAAEQQRQQRPQTAGRPVAVLPKPSQPRHVSISDFAQFFPQKLRIECSIESPKLHCPMIWTTVYCTAGRNKQTWQPADPRFYLRLIVRRLLCRGLPGPLHTLP